MSAQKVYIIKGPANARTPGRKAGRVGAAGRREAGSERRAVSGNSNSSNEASSWLLAIRAYVLGPINLILWPSGQGGMVWAIVAGVSLAGLAAMWMWSASIFRVLERSELGPAVWAVSVALVVLLTATAWARAVASVKPLVVWPRSVRRSGAVLTLGLILPGLGLLVAGRRGKAALAIWCAGLVVASAVIAAHWRWLAAAGAGGRASSAGSTIEGVLIISAGCLAVGLIALLALAFDGVRAVSPVARSGVVANGLALALLAAFIVFLTTFHPTSIASELNAAGMELKQGGLRVVPLALFETASRLDPGTPAYLAAAAETYRELGLNEAADAQHHRLLVRATQFAGAVGAELVPSPADEPRVPRPSHLTDRMPPIDVWLTDPDTTGLLTD